MPGKKSDYEMDLKTKAVNSYQVHKILEEQKKRGALIIIACHDNEELEMLSDEIIEIYEGRIVAGEKE